MDINILLPDWLHSASIKLLVLFLIHTVSLSMFRCVASYCQTMVAGSVGGRMAFLVILLFGGFVIPRSFLPNWLKWGFWLSPLSYAEIGLTGNEFLATRWSKITVSGVTLGRRILIDQGLDFSRYFYWISIGALIGFILLFNAGFAIGLTIKNLSKICPRIRKKGCISYKQKLFRHLTG